MLLSAIRVPDDSARKRFPFHASGFFPRGHAGYEIKGTKFCHLLEYL